MRDIPVFTTEFGIASLMLREVPYRQEAYIRIRSTENPAGLIRECSDFCKVCGAERVYGAGHPYLERYPLYTAVIQMQADRHAIPEPQNACLWPVLPENGEQWRAVYNRRMAEVPAASFMTGGDLRDLLREGGGYFVHRNGELLGIGRIRDDCIQAVAAVVPEAGETVMQALCSVLSGDRVRLEVASANDRAVGLYRRMGFLPSGEKSRWYRII